MNISFERNLRVEPDIPVVLAAQWGFSPLGELWPELQAAGVASEVDARRSLIEAARHPLVARIWFPADAARQLILAPSTESAVYRTRWGARRSDVWKDFIYAITSVAARTALGHSVKRTIRIGHFSEGGWPEEEALVSLEALLHLSRDGLETVIFGGCCIDPRELTRMYDLVIRRSSSESRQISVTSAEISPTSETISFSIPVPTYRDGV